MALQFLEVYICVEYITVLQCRNNNNIKMYNNLYFKYPLNKTNIFLNAISSL